MATMATVAQTVMIPMISGGMRTSKVRFDHWSVRDGSASGSRQCPERFVRSSGHDDVYTVVPITRGRSADHTMLRILSHPARLLMPGLLVGALLAQACGSDSNGPTVTPPDPHFALTLGAATISLSQGSDAGTYIKATRSGGLAAPITFTVSGAPTGLTVNVVPTSVSDSVSVAVTASATLAAGTY